MCYTNSGAPLIIKNGMSYRKGMTPIAKNEFSEGKKTVRVFSADGKQVGLTYPKRARGLVSKGRARYVNDCDIRLDVSDVTYITEDNKMDNNNINSLNGLNSAEMPKMPEIPKVPETAKLPDMPEIPKVPEAAKLPDMPEIPKVPEVARVPDIPEVQRVPGIPEIPKVPNVTDRSDAAPRMERQPVNKLFFNPRDWVFNKECKKNVGSRSFMQGPDGDLAEAFTLGNWGYDWTEIISRSYIFPKNTLHTFTFWLNGGENDQNDEVCRLEIIFNNDYESRLTYNLNRNFIKPVKKLNGWELYVIPFMTVGNEYTQLKFIAQRAYMTVMASKDAEVYANIPDKPDEFEEYRPQRHNIVFSDGFPTNTWYATKKLREKYGSQTADRSQTAENGIIPDDIHEMMQTVLNSDLPPNQKADLARELMDKINAGSTIVFNNNMGSAREENAPAAVDAVLKSGLDQQYMTPLINKLTKSGGVYDGTLVDSLLKDKKIPEKQKELLLKLKAKLADIAAAGFQKAKPQTNDARAFGYVGGTDVFGRIDEKLDRLNSMFGSMLGEMNGTVHSRLSDLGHIMDDVRGQIYNAVSDAIDNADSSDEIDTSYITEEILDGLQDRLSDIADTITDKLDEVQDAADEALDELKDALEETKDALDEMNDALEDMNDD